MTTTPAPSITTYPLSGEALGPFATGWRFSEAADVTVLLSLPSGQSPLSPPDYVLTAVAPLVGGGTVMLSPALLPSGGWPVEAKLILMRRTARRQAVALPDTEGHKPRATEAALDRAMRIAEEDRDTLDRAIIAPIGAQPPTPEQVMAAVDALPAVAAMRDEVAALVGDRKDRLLDWMPISLRPAIAAGTNTANLAPYINAALSVSRAVDLGGFTWLIKSRITPAADCQLLGRGTILAASNFDDGAVGDGMTMMIQVTTGLTIGEDVVLNGGSSDTTWMYGARNTGPVSRVRLKGCFRNLSFTGVDISSNGQTWANTDIVCTGRIENVGWVGANFEGVTGLDYSRLKVSRTGYHGVMASRCVNVVSDGLEVTKATPPFRIYNGPGSLGGAEGGFMHGRFRLKNARYSNWLLDDNWNAGEDGCGIGEIGNIEDDDSENVVFSNIQIRRAGLFGFDCSGGETGRGIQVFGSRYQGLMIGRDLGGLMEDIDVECQLFDCGVGEDVGAVRFLSPGAAPRTVSTVSGSATVTITGGAGFHIVPGQKVTGAGIQAGTYVQSISYAGPNPVVTLTKTATATASGVAVVFRGQTAFRNVRIRALVNGADWGADFEAGADGFTVYENVELGGDLSQNIANNSVRVLNGAEPVGARITPETRLKVSEDSLVGGAFTAFGRKSVRLTTGGNTFNRIVGGHDGQELVIFTGDACAVNYDWVDSQGFGANRLIGNGDVDQTIPAAEMIRARKRDLGAWTLTWERAQP